MLVKMYGKAIAVCLAQGDALILSIGKRMHENATAVGLALVDALILSNRTWVCDQAWLEVQISGS